MRPLRAGGARRRKEYWGRFATEIFANWQHEKPWEHVKVRGEGGEGCGYGIIERPDSGNPCKLLITYRVTACSRVEINFAVSVSFLYSRSFNLKAPC